MITPLSDHAADDGGIIKPTSRAKRETIDELLPGLVDCVLSRLRSAGAVKTMPEPDGWSIREADADGPLRVELKVIFGVASFGTVYAELRLGEDPGAAVERVAPRLAEALLRLHEEAPELRRAERLASRRALKAEESGLPCRLLSIYGAPTTVDWYRGFFLLLDVEALDDALRHRRERWAKHDCWGVRYSFDRLVREQAIRKDAREWLARHGATGAIDVVLLAVLRRSGFADVDLLREFDRPETRFRLVAPNGTEFDLRWRHGVVEGRVAVEEGLTWEAGELVFERAPRRFTRRHVGARLMDYVPDSAFPKATEILEVRGGAGGRTALRCSTSVELFRSGDERFIGDMTDVAIA